MATPRKRTYQRPQKEAWHLDKRVNVSIIVALLAQAAIALTWANHLSYDVAELKKDVGDLVETGRIKDAKLDVVIELKTLMTVLSADIRREQSTNRESFRRLWDVTRKLQKDIVTQRTKKR